ncbi:MAG: DNA primase [Alphaproteobacteria bacterium]|nr:MAG: DNA primase [Alphaproteobacteria bacterium]
MSLVEEIKSHVRLSDIIGRYFSLAHVNKSKFSICCPFHTEKTPSFSVQDDLGLFHCFGCGASGDLIKFVEKIENVTFIEACKKIADWYNIKYDSNTNQKSLLHYMEKLNQWFVSNLKHNLSAQAYIKARGIDQNMVTKFGIGWIPSFNKISEFMQKENLTDNIMMQLGLKYSLLKIFQNRISFPIYNQHKQVCSFAARTIDSGYGPKYINGSESNYFKKSSVLFGLHLINKTKPIIIVEGYMDVILLHQNNINAVSINSSTISKTHMETIFNLKQEAVLCLDGDDAGIKGFKNVIPKLLPDLNEHSLVSFMFLPYKEDPDSFIQKYGKQKWDELFERRVPLVRAIWDLFMQKSDIPEVEYKHYKNILTLGKTIQNKIIQDLYIKKWISLWKEKFQIKKANTYIRNSVAIQEMYERLIIGILLIKPELYNYVCEEFLSLVLSKHFSIMQELIPIWIKNYVEYENHSLDFFKQKGWTKIVDLCTSKDVMQLAPFLHKNVTIQELIKSYIFIMDRYRGINAKIK